MQKHPVDLHVGKKIRERRLKLKIAQADLGAAVGTRFQQIQKYETGANRVSASRLHDIAQALGVPITYFFEGLDPPAEDTERRARRASQLLSGPAAQAYSNREALAFLNAYAEMDDAQRRHLRDLVRSLARAINISEVAPPTDDEPEQE